MRFGLVLLILMLTACSSNLAPVRSYDADSRSSSSPPPSQYTVKRGDTLYSISFRYGMDYKRVAAINGIGPPYTIYVGQKIKFRGSPQPVKKSPSKTTAKASPQTKQKKPEPATRQQAREETQPSKPAPSGSSNPDWRWPTQGPLLSSFSDASPGRKGIKIAGKRGQDVIASAGGRVVYSGAGLVRYGNLLIIKHNDVYLSAYAHNDSLLVKEGDSVNAGQKIATLGSTGTNRDQLHFEIRRNGKPMDPMRFLPRQ